MNSIQTLAEVIQAAVAPVFLLAGIAGLLGVLSTRLARIVDRAASSNDGSRRRSARNAHRCCATRRPCCGAGSRSSTGRFGLCVSGALAVCLVIVALFLGELVVFNIATPIAVLFVLAMVLIVAGLVFLLCEVNLSTRHMREGMEIALADEAADSSQQR